MAMMIQNSSELVQEVPAASISMKKEQVSHSAIAAGANQENCLQKAEEKGRMLNKNKPSTIKSSASKAEAVSVHMIKLKELPAPLNMLEFRQICQEQGLPLQVKLSPRRRSVGEKLDFANMRKLKQQQMQEQWNDVGSNLFGAYMEIFNLFKNWHNGIVQQRDLGPKNVSEHIDSHKPKPPFQKRITSTLTQKDALHLHKQKELVNLLIQHGIGLENAHSDPSRPPALQSQSSRTKLVYKSPPNESEKPINGQANFLRLPTSQTRTDNKEKMIAPVVKFQSMRNLIKESTLLNGGVSNKRLSKIQRRQSFSGGGDFSLQLSKKSGRALPDEVSRGQLTKRHSQQSMNSFIEDEDEEEDENKDEDNIGSASDESSIAPEMLSVSNRDTKDNIEESIQNRCNAAERMMIITTPPQDSVFEQRQTQAYQAADSKQWQSSAPKKTENGLKSNALGIKSHNWTNQYHRAGAQQLSFMPIQFDTGISKELIETKRELKLVKEQLEKAEKRQQHTISQKLKEETAFQMQREIRKMPNHESNIIDTIKAKFFNATDGLDPSIVNILNMKLQEVRDYTLGQIRLISHHTETLRLQVDMLESMNQDGIKFEDMDTENLIMRIAQIEELTRNQNLELQRVDPTSKNRPEMNRPKVIWRLLKENFDPDYFLDVIADEYGIMPKANDFLAQKIKDYFDSELKEYEVKQEETVRFFEAKLMQRDETIAKLEHINEDLVRQNKIEKNKRILKMQDYLKAQYEAKVAALQKQFRNKFISLEQTIQKLVKEKESQYRSYKSLQMNYYFKRVQMFTAMKKLVSSIEEKDRQPQDELILKLCQKFFSEEELCLRYSANFKMPKSLVNEVALIEEVKRLEDNLSDLVIRQQWDENRANFCEMRVIECADEIKQLQKQNQVNQQELLTLSDKNAKLEDTIIALQKFTYELKLENKQLIVDDKKKEGSKFSLKTILQALRLKCNDEMAKYKLRQIKNTTRGNRYPEEKETITSINDVRRILIPKIQIREEQQTQTTREHLKDKKVQTTANSQKTSPYLKTSDNRIARGGGLFNAGREQSQFNNRKSIRMNSQELVSNQNRTLTNATNLRRHDAFGQIGKMRSMFKESRSTTVGDLQSAVISPKVIEFPQKGVPVKERETDGEKGNRIEVQRLALRRTNTVGASRFQALLPTEKQQSVEPQPNQNQNQQTRVSYTVTPLGKISQHQPQQSGLLLQPPANDKRDSQKKSRHATTRMSAKSTSSKLVEAPNTVVNNSMLRRTVKSSQKIANQNKMDSMSNRKLQRNQSSKVPKQNQTASMSNLARAKSGEKLDSSPRQQLQFSSNAAAPVTQTHRVKNSSAASKFPPINSTLARGQSNRLPSSRHGVAKNKTSSIFLQHDEQQQLLNPQATKMTRGQSKREIVSKKDTSLIFGKPDSSNKQSQKHQIGSKSKIVQEGRDEASNRSQNNQPSSKLGSGQTGSMPTRKDQTIKISQRIRRPSMKLLHPVKNNQLNRSNTMLKEKSSQYATNNAHQSSHKKTQNIMDAGQTPQHQKIFDLNERKSTSTGKSRCKLIIHSCSKHGEDDITDQFSPIETDKHDGRRLILGDELLSPQTQHACDEEDRIAAAAQRSESSFKSPEPMQKNNGKMLTLLNQRSSEKTLSEARSQAARGGANRKTFLSQESRSSSRRRKMKSKADGVNQEQVCSNRGDREELQSQSSGPLFDNLTKRSKLLDSGEEEADEDLCFIESETPNQFSPKEDTEKANLSQRRNSEQRVVDGKTGSIGLSRDPPESQSRPQIINIGISSLAETNQVSLVDPEEKFGEEVSKGAKNEYTLWRAVSDMPRSIRSKYSGEQTQMSVRVLQNGVMYADLQAATASQLRLQGQSVKGKRFTLTNLEQSKLDQQGLPRRLTLVDERTNHRESSSRTSEVTASHNNFGALTKRSSLQGSVYGEKNKNEEASPNSEEADFLGSDSNDFDKQQLKLNTERNTHVNRAYHKMLLNDEPLVTSNDTNTRLKTFAGVKSPQTLSGINDAQLEDAVGSTLQVNTLLLTDQVINTKQSSFGTSDDSSYYSANGIRKSKTTNKTGKTGKTNKTNEMRKTIVVPGLTVVQKKPAAIKEIDERETHKQSQHDDQKLQVASNEPPSVIKKLLDRGMLSQQQITCLQLLENGQQAPLGSNTAMIQKLLKKNYLTEEQFICLILLDKGYIPQRPAGQPPQDNSQTEQAMPHAQMRGADQDGNSHLGGMRSHAAKDRTFKTERLGKKDSRSRSKQGFINTRSLSRNSRRNSTGAYVAASSGQVTANLPTANRTRRSSQEHTNLVFVAPEYRILPSRIELIDKVFTKYYTRKQNVVTQTGLEEDEPTHARDENEPLVGAKKGASVKMKGEEAQQISLKQPFLQNSRNNNLDLDDGLAVSSNRVRSKRANPGKKTVPQISDLGKPQSQQRSLTRQTAPFSQISSVRSMNFLTEEKPQNFFASRKGGSKTMKQQLTSDEVFGTKSSATIHKHWASSMHIELPLAQNVPRRPLKVHNMQKRNKHTSSVLESIAAANQDLGHKKPSTVMCHRVTKPLKKIQYNAPSTKITSVCDYRATPESQHKSQQTMHFGQKRDTI